MHATQMKLIFNKIISNMLYLILGLKKKLLFTKMNEYFYHKDKYIIT